MTFREEALLAGVGSATLFPKATTLSACRLVMGLSCMAVRKKAVHGRDRMAT